ncbi:MAG: conserved phage C-terminal domain-containing protein [Gammaproteobacteria bacterium]|nr:conserved phage C-terminal domain-containing protein [Gammaproteobacteria bacterium]
MQYLRIRNWEKFQDTAGRNAPYIKIQTSILLDMEFMCLPNDERLCFLLLLVYAGINSNKLPADPEYLMHLCHLDVTPNVTLMMERGLIEEWCPDKHTQMLDKYEEKLSGWRERKRKQRDREREQQGSHSHVTLMSPLETETETETETKDIGTNVPCREQTPDAAPINGKELSSEAREVLAFLNESTGHSYREVAANLDPIKARLKEAHGMRDLPGSPVQVCKGVIAKKKRKWAKDDKMAEFLRPKTLFAKSNFWNYQGE